MNSITFTPESFGRFKALAQQCPAGEVFIFEGHEVLKEYAKLMIEYVEFQINKAVTN